MKKETMIVDGNMAAAYVSYAFTEVAAIFPITPSSPMAEQVDEWSSEGKENIFGQPVNVVELQSEGGAAGTVHGSLGAGALTTTYTASQGLLLMVPNMYKISGELLPGVFHVSARTLSVHGLSIFGDHSDVMACRQTGFALLASTNPQEVMDLGAVSHLSAIKGSIPFLHYFDGFRTSHEMQKIDALNYDDLAELVDYDAIKAFRKRALNPERPCTRGTTQNPDIFFQQREAANNFYTAIPGVVEHYMNKINELTGKDYKLYNYYGAEDADRIIVAMGSVCDSLRETTDYLLARGEKVGFVNVHLYRPFAEEYFLNAIPKTVKKIAVLDRTKEPGSMGEPLYQDVCTIYQQKKVPVEIYGGRYGLSSKDTTPSQLNAVFENLASDAPRNNFTIGIEDDVTHLSLSVKEEIDASSKEVINCKLWGLGSDGTVGANKNTVKIIGEHTDLFVQAYFVYDSKKSGGLTQSHLRFGKEPIRSSYLVNAADFVACHNISYIDKYDLAKDIKQGGIFLLNAEWSDEELDEKLPNDLKRKLAEKQARFYVIDATGIAKDLGMGGRINTILQAAFFKLVGVIPIDQAVKYMKDAIYKTYYAKHGQKLVDANYAAVDNGISKLRKVEIPEKWLLLSKEVKEDDTVPAFISQVVSVMNSQEGDSLPVSTFVGMEDGSFPPGTSAYEKRGVAVDVPEWDIEKCIQCNQCAYVCPHAAIRPILLDETENAQKPMAFKTLKATGKELGKYQYRIQVSPLDCTGCGVCVNTCPVKDKALVMKALGTQLAEKENWKYAVDKVTIKEDAVSSNSIKSSQFAQPLFEFSGACAGCGETPYIKLITQLYGSRMYVGNASGCSSAYGGSTPSTPYTVDKSGHGPAWAMSLFEDNAEYVYGMYLGAEQIRLRLIEEVKYLSEVDELKEAAVRYLDHKDSPDKTLAVSNELVKSLEGYSTDNPEQRKRIDSVIQNREYLSKKSFWAFGGDGWAYDIGYGGLDHVLASGRDVNVLVMDTEVYSNTGGQASKATATGAVSKFASAGKEVKKKDLGLMAMSYGYVYVAQIAMGADQAQTLKAIREAEAYPGPSLIIAYCPCTEHGLRKGMAYSQEQMKSAVDAGYWHLYRYNPLLKDEGKNPFILDSKEPKGDLKEFLYSENRYSSLGRSFPERVDALFDKAGKDAAERFDTYKKLAQD